jgi:hypothetical protein
MKALAGVLGIFFLASFAIFSVVHLTTLQYAASHCDAGTGVALCDAFGSTLASFASAVGSSVPQLFVLALLVLAAALLVAPLLRSETLFAPTATGPAPPASRMPGALAHLYQELFASGILNTRAY